MFKKYIHFLFRFREKYECILKAGFDLNKSNFFIVKRKKSLLLKLKLKMSKTNSKKIKPGPPNERHRKVMRDAIQQITKADITRLARRSGVKRISGLVYEEIRGVLKVYLQDLVRKSIYIMEHSRLKTLKEIHVREALQFDGITPLFKSGPKTVKKESTKDSEKTKKRAIHKYINIDTYVMRVLKQVHPEVSITGTSLAEVSQFGIYLTLKITELARKLAMNEERKTLTSGDVQTAVRLILPGELAKHAVSEGTKAISKFNSSLIVTQDSSGKQKTETRSQRAGLAFSISRIENIMRGQKKTGGDKTSKDRVGSGSAIYLTAVVEYLTAEILELAGNAARDNGLVRIKPRHIMLAIRNDEELNKLAHDMGIIIVDGGVLPNIHTVLLPKQKRKKSKDDVY